MKRFLFMIIVLSLSVCALFASGKEEGMSNNGKPDVVAVNFPAYDFARQIAGDRVNLTMLLPPGAESHSFEPTPRDIIRIRDCDIFIYVGGENDVWVDRVLESMDTSKKKIIRMMDAVDVVVEEIVEGMEDDGHDHEHDHAELNPADVEDRPLSDFSGNWKASVPYLKDGSVDAYFERAAEESGMTPADVKAMYINMMRTDYPTLTVTSDSIAINGVSAKATTAYLLGICTKRAERRVCRSTGYLTTTDTRLAVKKKKSFTFTRCTATRVSTRYLRLRIGLLCILTLQLRRTIFLPR
jgi:zinc transport system substrate-binding protein